MGYKVQMGSIDNEDAQIASYELICIVNLAV